MFSLEALELMQCAISKDKHIVMNPITLSCGHPICKNCVPLTSSITIKCLTCNEINEINLQIQKESKATKGLLRLHLNDLFEMIKVKFMESIEQLKAAKKSFEDLLNLRVEYIHDEIEIRIESLKNNLDKIHEEFKSDLTNLKEFVLREKIDSIDTNQYDKKLLQLKLDNSQEYNKTEAKFFEYQHELNRINNLVRTYEQNDFKLSLDVSNFKAESKQLIGEIVFQMGESILDDSSGLGSLGNRLKSKAYKTIELDYQPTDVCVLPNGTLLVCCFDAGLVCFFDKNFKLKRVIERINGKPFKALSACTNTIDRIYISDCLTHTILMTDLDLNFIKSSLFNPSLFRSFHGVYYFNSFVYVCDNSSKLVHKFSANLDRFTSYHVECKPWLVCMNNKVACIRSYPDLVSFHDRKTFDCLTKYDGLGGDIIAINELFLVYCPLKCLFYIFDSNGKDREEIKANAAFTSLLNNGYHGLTLFNGQLIMTTRESKRLIII